MTQLAEASTSSKSRLSHAVARLEERGWVRRTDCPTDRRGQIAQLTDEGFAALAAAAPGHVDQVRRSLIDRLTPEQVEQLREISAAIIEGADPDVTAGGCLPDRAAGAAPCGLMSLEPAERSCSGRALRPRRPARSSGRRSRPAPEWPGRARPSITPAWSSALRFWLSLFLASTSVIVTSTPTIAFSLAVDVLGGASVTCPRRGRRTSHLAPGQLG